MNTTRTTAASMMLAALAATTAGVHAEIGTAFTYQGLLTEAGANANGSLTFTFDLYAGDIGGVAIESSGPVAVDVTDGHFTVPLDFGADALADGGWLQITVEGEALSPRQPLTPAPYALQLRNLTADDQGNITIGPFGQTPVGNMTLTSLGGIELIIDADTNNVGGESQNARLRLRQDGGASAARIGFENNNEFTMMVEAPQVLRLGTDDTDRMVITAGGEVGIATSATEGQLHVVRPVGGSDPSLIAETQTVNGQFLERTGVEFLGTDVDSFAFAVGQIGTLRLNANTDEHITLAQGGGRVAIGTSPTNFTLCVNGTAAKPGGGLWAVCSDARLKTNVEPLTGALDRLMKLRGYEYEYTQEAIENHLATPGPQIGLMADDIEPIFPDWVDVDDAGYRYVSERGTTALMVEALRDLRDEKDAEIAAMQARIERLEQMLPARREP